MWEWCMRSKDEKDASGDEEQRCAVGVGEIRQRAKGEEGETLGVGGGAHSVGEAEEEPDRGSC